MRSGEWRGARGKDPRNRVPTARKNRERFFNSLWRSFSSFINLQAGILKRTMHSLFLFNFPFHLCSVKFPLFAARLYISLGKWRELYNHYHNEEKSRERKGPSPIPPNALLPPVAPSLSAALYPLLCSLTPRSFPISRTSYTWDRTEALQTFIYLFYCLKRTDCLKSSVFLDEKKLCLECQTEIYFFSA